MRALRVKARATARDNANEIATSLVILGMLLFLTAFTTFFAIQYVLREERNYHGWRVLVLYRLPYRFLTAARFARDGFLLLEYVQDR